MKNLKLINKFETMIRRLDYPNIMLTTPPYSKIKDFAKQHMTKELSQMNSSGWDLHNIDTYLELVYINTSLLWYQKRVAVYLTPSYVDYKQSMEVIDSELFQRFRNVVGFDYHVVILLSPIIFLEPEELDDIWVAIDKNKGTAVIDMSGFIEDEDGLDIVAPNKKQFKYLDIN